jgi:hypothetical protein
MVVVTVLLAWGISRGARDPSPTTAAGSSSAPTPPPSVSGPPSVDLPEAPFRLRGVRVDGMPSTAWRRWTASDGSFVIDAPGPGTVVRGERDGMWSIRFNASAASLDLFVEPAPPGWGPSALANRQVRGWARGLDEGPPGRPSPIRAGEAEGWQVVVPDDGGSSRWYLRVYVHGRRIYYLSVRRTLGDPESERYRRRFLSSFAVPADDRVATSA